MIQGIVVYVNLFLFSELKKTNFKCTPKSSLLVTLQRGRSKLKRGGGGGGGELRRERA